MPQLYLIISNLYEPSYSLSGWLRQNRDALFSQNAIFQGIKNYGLGLPNLNPLINELGFPGKTPKALAIIDDLAKQADGGRDIIWLTKSIRFAGLANLREYLAENEVFAKYTVRPVMILQNQLRTMDSLLRRFWKKSRPGFYAGQLEHPETSTWCGPYLAELEKVFGKENCNVVPFFGDYAAFGNNMAAALNVAGALPALSPAVFPSSFAALDLTYAIRDFPFYIPDKNDTRRQKFYDALARAEKEEGYEIFQHIPQDVSRKYMELFSEANAEFIREHGPAYEFLNDWPSFPDMPPEIPGLTPDACDVFVKALDADFRRDLDEFFRKRGALGEDEKIIAKSLDDYRRMFFPVSPDISAREPTLCVLTMAYNQKKYILECMESVAAQKTDFPVEHIVVDDCSDDGTQDLIDNFASTHPNVRPIYFPYRSAGRNIRVMFNACRSEYAALCDGDDYFTEPTKLQKQVEFLRENRDCALCFHPVLALYENNEQDPFIFPQKHLMPRGFHEKYYLADLIRRNFIQTNSVVYRWRFRDGLPDWFHSDLCPGDWYWHLLHAERGKIGFIPEVMSVYRRHPGSIYAKSFQSTSVEHRRDHGLSELYTYKAINEHFDNRYFRHLSSLANGVLMDFLQIQLKEGDSALLDWAVEHYPEFGLHFLKELKKHP